MEPSTSIRQWIATLSCALCTTSIGAAFVWMTPLMLTLTGPESPVPMTSSDSSWLASIIELGAMFATIPTGLLADRFGRKSVLLFAGPLVLTSWILTLATRSIEVLYIVRICQGFSLCTAYVLVPIYIAEISEPRIRGLLSGQFQTFFYLGTLYAYSTGPYLNYNTYILSLAVVPVLFMVTFAMMPESPYYLLMSGQTERARHSLCWLRCSCDVDKEFNMIKANVQEDMSMKADWRDLIATKTDRKALLIVLLVSAIKYMSGKAAISMYITQTLAEDAEGMLAYNTITIIQAVMLTITSFVAAFLSDVIGRKPLLIGSSFAAGIFNAIIALYFYLENQTTVDVSSYSWVLTGSLICFCIVGDLGLGTLAHTIQAEYFASRTRSIGGAFTQLVSSMLGFISIKMYQVVEDDVGVYFNYFIFSCILIAGSIFFSFVFLETSGRDLTQIQREMA
ncbi:facilitated trehalose transporter Tret1-like [Rhodnius prolixus]|uniref:facilitated trehalose transporter Tret1-like n=1 Tax=Rhodnius prolixus TaxID=13249 RepID=UPI003D18804F